MSDEKSQEEEQEKMILEKASQLLSEQDSWTLIEVLGEGASPEKTSARFSNLIRYLYFQKKDISGMILAGRTGIQYALAEAKNTDGDESNHLLSRAKEMSYNLSVNCWPGWGDEGIEMNNTVLKAGMDCALLNLRLAIELKRDAEKVGNAHWLIGAHELALGNHEKAIDSFEKASADFKTAGKDDFYWMSQGYLGMAQDLSGNEKGESLEKEAQEELLKIGTDDAKYFVEQLKSVKKIFQK